VAEQTLVRQGQITRARFFSVVLAEVVAEETPVGRTVAVREVDGVEVAEVVDALPTVTLRVPVLSGHKVLLLL
jgi:hypothetical protein